MKIHKKILILLFISMYITLLFFIFPKVTTQAYNLDSDAESYGFKVAPYSKLQSMNEVFHRKYASYYDDQYIGTTEVVYLFTVDTRSLENTKKVYNGAVKVLTTPAPKFTKIRRYGPFNMFKERRYFRPRNHRTVITLRARPNFTVTNWAPENEIPSQSYSFGLGASNSGYSISASSTFTKKGLDLKTYVSTVSGVVKQDYEYNYVPFNNTHLVTTQESFNFYTFQTKDDPRFDVDISNTFKVLYEYNKGYPSLYNNGPKVSFKKTYSL